METLKNAAHVYSGLKDSREDYDEQYYNPDGCLRYDAFLAGTMAPETEAYYKAKYSHIVENTNCIDVDMDSMVKHRVQVLQLVKEGSLLMAVKVWKEANPGMGLREAKEYIDTLRK